MNPISFVILYRRLVLNAVKSDVKARFAGSVVGMGWLVLNPLLFLSFYSVVYLFIFKLRPIAMPAEIYVLHILAGILPFLAISESLSQGAGVLASNREIFKNTVFPAEALVVRVILVAHVQLGVGIALLLFVAGIMGRLDFEVLLLPFILILQMALLIGLSWITSLIALVFRDLQSILSFVSMAIMIGSPIAYTEDMIPHSLRFFLWLNPFSHFILTYQSILVHQRLPSYGSLLAILILPTVVFFLGYFVFVRIKRVVANFV